MFERTDLLDTCALTFQTHLISESLKHTSSHAFDFGTLVVIELCVVGGGGGGERYLRGRGFLESFSLTGLISATSELKSSRTSSPVSSGWLGE